MVKNRIILFILAFLLWLLLSWSLSLKNLMLAVAIGALISWLAADMFVGKSNVLNRPTRYLWFLYYVPLFIWECIKANVDGAYRVLHPDLPIKPGIVKVKTTLKSDTGLTFLANTITLKPGTMTVDIDKEKGLMYIHWVDVRTQDTDKATKLLIGKFENILKRIFE
ncbi:MAG: Na+/H+ antiporter subunit E [Candidatus Omnitrophica bacterium]|nr:Na+/H+ antiporter subunit E [Candidatus Omnitrophota bacterium]MBU1869318.1 Na+/H+ antiporter subunit E [Candidatus Omnitrophota bacterium]